MIRLFKNKIVRISGIILILVCFFRGWDISFPASTSRIARTHGFS